LPDFEGSIPPMKYLITSVFWMAMIHPFSYFLVVIRKQAFLLPIIGGACVLAFFANLYSLTHGFGILGVGIATTIVFFCNFTATYFLACKYLYRAGETWLRYLYFIGKFIFMILIMIALNWLIPQSDRFFGRSLGQFGLFVLIYLPFLMKLNRDLGIFEAVMKKIFPQATSPAPVQED
jgi:O-antigen/teichoic acid export membrane protein